MSYEYFSNLVKSIPHLVDTGIDSRRSCRHNKVEYPQSNSLLLSQEGYEAFSKCVAWLKQNCSSVKTVSANSPTSRTLQQIAKEEGYVSNGAMIAAIISEGYPYKIVDDAPNILVGISRKSACFKSN